jgi:DNA-binding PadR family transcriptional regulator
MADSQSLLGAFEEVVLRATQHLSVTGYGVTIHAAIEQALGRRVSFGAVYATLDRLEVKGLVKSWLGEPTPQRGGKAKRYYRIMGAGVAAIERAELVRARLTPGVVRAGT